MIADCEDADADKMLEEHKEQMFVTIVNGDLDGMTVSTPPLTPLPPPEEVATPVANDLTYISEMLDL